MKSTNWCNNLKFKTILNARFCVVLFLTTIFGVGFLENIMGFAFFEQIPILPFCLFKTITGWMCPGCGMTRALLAIGRFDFSAALHFNPLSFCVVAFIFFYAVYGYTPEFTKNRQFLLIFFCFMMFVHYFRPAV